MWQRVGGGPTKQGAGLFLTSRHYLGAGGWVGGWGENLVQYFKGEGGAFGDSKNSAPLWGGLDPTP